MEYNKKLNKAGSLTLPAAMRRELGIDRGDRFRIVVQDEGTIELRRIQGECIFCKDNNNLLIYAGRFVCNRCLQNMNEIKDDRSDDHG
jgi:transcriptional pleiotropic regulator of transition state genes